MRWPRGTDMTPGRVLGLMAPGEELLSDVLVTSFAQGSAVGGRPRANVGIDWNPLVGGVTIDDDRLGGALTGYSAGGHAGAAGDQFAGVLADLGQARLLLTSQRLVLYESGEPQHGLGVLPFAIDRTLLTDVRVAPRLLQHSRLRLQFADRSWAMATAGMLLPAAALRFARSYRASRPGSHGQ